MQPVVNLRCRMGSTVPPGDPGFGFALWSPGRADNALFEALGQLVRTPGEAWRQAVREAGLIQA